ncbi:hypothetical protein [Trueperella sp. LYQ143]|uniref:hypothetical protein n=1 Tax=Trueperella sp. LYQ143 TaxID=3391059 RepID=UPI0039831189
MDNTTPFELVCARLDEWEPEMVMKTASQSVSQPAAVARQSVSPVECSVMSRERLAEQLGLIRAYALALGWRFGDGRAAGWIVSRLDVARKTFPDYGRMVEDLDRIYRAWRAVLEPVVSAHTCPICLSERLEYHANGGLVCRGCDYYGTAEQVRVAVVWRLAGARVWVSRGQACAVAGVSRAALRNRIARGTVRTRSDGRVWLADVIKAR